MSMSLFASHLAQAVGNGEGGLLLILFDHGHMGVLGIATLLLLPSSTASLSIRQRMYNNTRLCKKKERRRLPLKDYLLKKSQSGEHLPP